MITTLQEAQTIAEHAGLRVTNPRKGIFNLYRNTTPKLTFIGQRVSPDAMLKLVKQAARVE